jgi:predicted aspartyl protease
MQGKLFEAVFFQLAAVVLAGTVCSAASADDAGSVGAKPVPFSLAKPDKPLIILETIVDNEGPFRFVLDTGAGATVITPALAEKLNIESDRGQAPRRATGAGGSLDVRLGRVKSIRVGETRVEDLAVVIMDLTGIGQAIEMEIDGIIGYNFLKTFRVSIDYPQQTVSFE